MEWAAGLFSSEADQAWSEAGSMIRTMKDYKKMGVTQINFLNPFAVCICSTQPGTSLCSGNTVVDLQIITNIYTEIA